MGIMMQNKTQKKIERPTINPTASAAREIYREIGRENGIYIQNICPYSGTSLIGIPMGQKKVSLLVR